MKLLLLEDDPETADFVAQMLRSHGHVVDLATTGPDAIFLATSVAYAVLILDRMVPGVDGLGVLRTLRGAGIQTPALFLSALGEISDRVEGSTREATTIWSSPLRPPSCSPASRRWPAVRLWRNARR
jgi:two-component system OmpR family response regulator